MIIDIILIISLFLILIFAGYLVVGMLIITPFYPSRTKDLDKIWEELKPEIKKDLEKVNFVDVGSGEGRVVRWAAKKGMNAYGIELNPFLTLYSRFRGFISPNRKRITTLNQNFNHQDFSKYDVVYLYIYREHMDTLLPKFEKELKNGSLIISNVFKFTDKEPDKKINRFNLYYIKK